VLGDHTNKLPAQACLNQSLVTAESREASSKAAAGCQLADTPPAIQHCFATSPCALLLLLLLLQATRQLEVIAGLNPSSQTLPTSRGKDLLHPKPSGTAARVAAATAAAAATKAQQQYDTAAAAAADASTAAAVARLAQQQQSGSSSTGGEITIDAALQQRVQAAGAAALAAAAARDAVGAVSAADELNGEQVFDGPDTAVLEFAVALAHHHDAITGTTHFVALCHAVTYLVTHRCCSLIAEGELPTLRFP